MEPLFEGEKLLTLLPQREPMLMIDRVWTLSENDITTGLKVLPTNIFVADGLLCEPGIIEHMAQSAAAMQGWICQQQCKPVEIRYLCEVKRFIIEDLPRINETLHSHLSVVAVAGCVMLMHCITNTERGPVASGTIKISVQ